MTTLRDAAQQALEALESCREGDYTTGHVIHPSFDEKAVAEAEAALRAALAEQPAEQEPVNIGPEWAPCVKLPVTVHVRQQRPGETHVSTREGITPIKPDDLIMRGVSGEEYPIGREIFERTYRLGEAPQPAIPPGYKLVPEVPTNEWINNLAKIQTGPLEDVPFADIYQCIAELLDTAPEAPQPAKLAEQEPVAWWHRKSNTVTSGNLVSNFAEWAPLYTAPQPAKQPLTDDEIVQVLGGVRESITGNVFFAFARAIEAAHGINVPQAQGEQE